MARAIGRLTALKVDRARRPGMYADGGGLYLRVTDNGDQKLGVPVHAEWPDPLDGDGTAPHRRARRGAQQSGRVPIAAARWH